MKMGTAIAISIIWISSVVAVCVTGEAQLFMVTGLATLVVAVIGQ